MKTNSSIPGLNYNFNFFFFVLKKFLPLILFFLANIISLKSDWEACNNGTPYCELFPLIVDSNYIYAGFDCGLFISSNNGDYWILKNKELIANALAIKDNNIYVGTYGGGIQLSTDKGETWAYKNNGLLTSKPSNVPGIINTILISGNNVFAGTKWGVFLSTDNGDNWIVKNNGLPPLDTITSLFLNISSLIQTGNNIFAGTHNGVYMTTDNGDNWTAKNKGLTNQYIWALAIKDKNIFTATDSTIYLSTDNGDSWVAKNKWNSILGVNSIFIYDNYIFVGTTYKGVLFSTDNGENWTEKNAGIGPENTGIYSLVIKENYIFASDEYNGIFRAKLSDFGITDVKEQNNYNKSSFEIYPNPASSSVKLKYESTSYSKLQISIFDLLGNEVLNTSEECNIGMNEKIIDCHSLETGYYIIRLKQGERVETKPFVKITNY